MLYHFMSTYCLKLSNERMWQRMLKIKLVESFDELAKVIAIRSIVYIHGQNCPYDEEFDKNDFTSTQIIGSYGNEPIMCARIRYFDGAVKLERLAIREEYRGRRFGHELLKFMIEFCDQKGFNELYLHAATRLVPFYQSYGFVSFGNIFSFSGQEYMEMRMQNISINKKLYIGKLPIHLDRPENELDVPGPLESNCVEYHMKQVV